MAAIRTFGHGTASADEIVALLRGAGIGTVVDVRRYPGSRRHPHVSREAIEGWLPEAGIGYRWLEALGGRRRPTPGSPNIGLRNEQFRAYADHMASPEFATGIDELLDLATGGEGDTVVMCSESVWWRCHRRLLADHLVLVEEVLVAHLFHDGRLTPHAPTPEARLDGDKVVYDVGIQLALEP